MSIHYSKIYNYVKLNFMNEHRKHHLAQIISSRITKLLTVQWLISESCAYINIKCSNLSYITVLLHSSSWVWPRRALATEHHTWSHVSPIIYTKLGFWWATIIVSNPADDSGQFACSAGWLVNGICFYVLCASTSVIYEYCSTELTYAGCKVSMHNSVDGFSVVHYYLDRLWILRLSNRSFNFHVIAIITVSLDWSVVGILEFKANRCYSSTIECNTGKSEMERID